MHESMSQTRPAVSPDEIEWAFAAGQPAIVAHIPNEWGDYEAVRLDHTAPENEYRREMIRALLRLAQRQLDISEPANTAGAVR